MRFNSLVLLFLIAMLFVNFSLQQPTEESEEVVDFKGEATSEEVNDEYIRDAEEASFETDESAEVINEDVEPEVVESPKPAAVPAEPEAPQSTHSQAPSTSTKGVPAPSKSSVSKDVAKGNFLVDIIAKLKNALRCLFSFFKKCN